MRRGEKGTVPIAQRTSNHPTADFTPGRFAYGLDHTAKSRCREGHATISLKLMLWRCIAWPGCASVAPISMAGRVNGGP